MQKGSGLVYILAGILLLAIVIGVHYLETRKTAAIIQPNPVFSPIRDETANWKIYKDDKNGFSFNYPSTWTVASESSTNSVVVGPYTETDLQNIKGGMIVDRTADPTVLRVNLIPKKYFADIMSEDTLNKKLTQKDTLIGEKSALEYTFEVLSWGSQKTGVSLYPPGSRYTRLLIDDGDQYINIEHIVGNNQNIYDQVLSTFKFTN